MTRTPARKLADALRLLWPPAEDRAYARLLRGSPAFDRAFYLASNPRLHPLFRLLPERHYVREGEAMGLMPNPRFSPYAYLIHNPDLAARGVRPLRHWIEAGAAEGRTVLLPEGAEAALPALPPAGPADRPDPAAPFAVALHLYYPALWDEFAAALLPQRFRFDLFATLTGPAAQGDLPERIRAAFPAARVWTVPNRGRDILPFAHLAGSGLLDPYRAVLKLHGKASPHRRDGADWRRALVAGVLGEPAATEARLARFLATPGAGLWAADGHIVAGEDWWGANRPRAAALLARAGLPAPPPLRFAQGSIYWIAPALLRRLAALALTAADFEPEQGLVDGTTAHAVERALGSLAAQAGLALLAASDLDVPAGNGPSGHRGTDPAQAPAGGVPPRPAA